jgi:hypothetical protein
MAGMMAGMTAGLLSSLKQLPGVIVFEGKDERCDRREV